MYQHDERLPKALNETFAMNIAIEQQLAEYIQFAAANIGAPEHWLKNYYGKLIKRSELFGYWNKGILIATGECRLFDQYQCEYADLGMIVAQSARGKGIAKQVLQYLTAHASSKGLKSICSTESNNLSAQKAISSVGFLAMNRIVQFEFNLA